MAEVHENTSSGIGVVPMPAITEDPCQGNTLLPHPIASVISFAARSSSLSLRVGTFFGNAAVSGARATTLTGLECGRGILEGIISRAGRDVVDNSTGDQAKEAMESYIEWTVRFRTSVYGKVDANYCSWPLCILQLHRHLSGYLRDSKLPLQHFLMPLLFRSIFWPLWTKYSGTRNLHEPLLLL